MKFFIKAGLLVSGFLIFLWFWIFGHQGLYEMEQLRRVRSELMQEKIKVEQDKKNLEAEQKHSTDPQYIKHLIHRELGYIEKNEVMVKFHK